MSGFTLIEVLVAFMILTLSLTVLFRIFSGGLASVATSGDYSRAVQIAESQLAAAGISEPLTPGVTYGDAGDLYQWQRTVEQYVPNGESGYLQGPVSAYRVGIEVSWTRDGREKKVRLDTMRLQAASDSSGAG